MVDAIINLGSLAVIIFIILIIVAHKKRKPKKLYVLGLTACILLVALLGMNDGDDVLNNEILKITTESNILIDDLHQSAIIEYTTEYITEAIMQATAIELTESPTQTEATAVSQTTIIAETTTQSTTVIETVAPITTVPQTTQLPTTNIIITTTQATLPPTESPTQPTVIITELSTITEPVIRFTVGIHKNEEMHVVTSLSDIDKFSVFWGHTGDRVHISPNCSSFRNGVLFGTLENARNAERYEWCGTCSRRYRGNDGYGGDDMFRRDGNPNIR